MPTVKERASQSMAAKKDKPKGSKLDDNGGESIGVEITVNGKRYYHRTASITGDSDGDQSKNRRYKTDAGAIINHKRNDGIKDLAKKIIDS